MTLVLPLRREKPSRPVAPTPKPPARPPEASAPGKPTEPASVRQWIGVLAMVFGMFMALLDIQIVTSSLTQIQGGLSASPDEISWVQTAYLIAEVVMIPLSGTLSRLVSTRVLYVVSTIGFTLTSALCASATSLDEMIVFRVMQGFLGGAMIPTVFPVVYMVFPPRQLAVIMVFISLINGFAIMYGGMEATLARQQASTGVTPDQHQAALVAALASAAATGQYPNLAAAMAASAPAPPPDADEMFDSCVSPLIDIALAG